MELAPQDLITQGRRDLVCGDISKAVDNFQKACEALSTIHGDFHEALAVPNLLYGTALLELSRIESSVIGNALDGIPDPDKDDSESDNEIIEPGPELTTEEKEDISNQVIDAMCEENNQENSETKEDDAPSEDIEGVGGNDAPSKDIEAVSRNDAAGDNPTDDAVEEAEGGESNECEGDEPEDQDELHNNPTDSEAAKSDDEDDVSNLQIAWEVIEVAKKLFSQKDDEESKLNVAECLEKLGEISREKEDYDQAVMDLKECLEIRTAILGQKDRRVAESHYQLGTTYAVSGDLGNASSSFKASVECLKLLAEDVRSKIEAVDQKDGEEKELLQVTLKEIELLIPDVQSRCADIEEDRLAESIKQTESSMEPCSNGTSVPTDDISHLVRKKRPVSGTTPVESVENISLELNGHGNSTSKKVKLIDSNGESLPNENGV
ncbi:putative nuclear autoantigenic sperm protein (nasp) [Schistosoma mansoni]|uniref:Putative nuclear autoantigenic sperm protein (Nasp) n=1 Tax=Schistosoma mansoni TaxID=6183 RepID=G4VNL6_SCHMA|nr:putative nuclear autoantigenic sperm protein (nasp) [Schistosoma mansoni]|eukprot:XP_018654809.1 putative nuclear autoantigenic sperm protein (nasp) [Schistosoma mansoni]